MRDHSPEPPNPPGAVTPVPLADGGGDLADSLCKSANSMTGKPGVTRMRQRAQDARHLQMARELGLV